MVKKFIKRLKIALAVLLEKTTMEKASEEIEEILKKQLDREGKLTLRRVFMTGFDHGYRARNKEILEQLRQMRKGEAKPAEIPKEEGEGPNVMDATGKDSVTAFIL